MALIALGIALTFHTLDAALVAICVGAVIPLGVAEILSWLIEQHRSRYDEDYKRFKFLDGGWKKVANRALEPRRK